MYVWKDVPVRRDNLELYTFSGFGVCDYVNCITYYRKGVSIRKARSYVCPTTVC